MNDFIMGMIVMYVILMFIIIIAVSVININESDTISLIFFPLAIITALLHYIRYDLPYNRRKKYYIKEVQKLDNYRYCSTAELMKEYDVNGLKRILKNNREQVI